MANWEKFDSMIDTKALNEQIESAKQNDFTGGELPSGDYQARVEKLELGETKDHRPMVKCQMRITDGKYKNWCIFYNRVLYGTKNDGSMIHSANVFLRSLVDWEPDEIKFESYSDYADLIEDVESECMGTVFDVTYDPTAFDSVVVK